MIKAEEARERTRTSGGTYINQLVKSKLSDVDDRIKVASKMGRYDITLARHDFPELFSNGEALSEIVSRLENSGYRVKPYRLPKIEGNDVIDFLDINWRPRRRTQWLTGILKGN